MAYYAYHRIALPSTRCTKCQPLGVPPAVWSRPDMVRLYPFLSFHNRRLWKMSQLQEVTAMLETVTPNPRYIELPNSLPGHLALIDANGLPEGLPISKHIWLWNDKREKGFLFCLFGLVFVFVLNRRFRLSGLNLW